MQKIIIEGSKARYVDLTAQEIADLLVEIATRKTDEKTRSKREAKRVVIGKLAELREMKQNRTIFSQQDLDDKQAEIDELVATING